MKNLNNETLLGIWVHDPTDTESIRRFGNVKLYFTADGHLIYTILGKEKDQKAYLTYRIENNVLITDQPSSPREERTNFRITEEGKLEQECSDGGTVRYIRILMSVKTHKAVIYTIPNFAEFVGFYGAHMVWSLKPLNSTYKSNFCINNRQ